MQSLLFDLNDQLKNNNLVNNKLNKVIQEYSFIEVTKQSNLDQNQQILENIKKSNVIIISQLEIDIKATKYIYIVLSFERTLLFIEQSQKTLIAYFFSKKENPTIFFMSNFKNYIDKCIDIKYNLFDDSDNFAEEVISFNKQLCIFKISKVHKINFVIWKSFIPFISGYLIKQSYSKLSKDRISEFYSKENINSDYPKDWNENDYIELRQLGVGSLFSVYLIYVIEKEELLALKKPHLNDEEVSKLYKREVDNYLKTKDPLIPKFYGTIKSKYYLFIEFIDGKSLKDTKVLSPKDKILIINGIMLIILYFHINKYVLNDIKPNNILIDKRNTIVMIDFNKMIKDTDMISINTEFSNDFGTKYTDPNVYNGKVSYKNDIYSLGMVISHVINKKEPGDNSSEKINYFYKYPEIKQIYNKCFKEKPTINILIIEYYKTYFSQIEVSLYRNHIYAQLFIGGSYLSRQNNDDIVKAAYYFKLGADKNLSDSQYNLGLLLLTFYNKIYDAIKYFNLAAEQNHFVAQYCLGKIYIKGRYVEKNINKGIKYLTLSANQNFVFAQHDLGCFYLNNMHPPMDQNKAIHYLTLAADQNFPNDQYIIGRIYYEGKIVKIDIEKSIKYLKSAVNQNHIEAQYFYGRIYYEGKNVKRDIEKSIKYLTSAANQNYVEAQYFLGTILIDGKYGEQNINMGTYYLMLAANQNHNNAQYKLALFFYNIKNFDQAVHYFTLSANNGDRVSQFYLFLIFDDKNYPKNDSQKAYNYLMLCTQKINKIDPKIIKMNENYTNYMHGKLLYDGIIEQMDINRAIYYLKLAANNNYPDAQYLLGIIYSEDKYIPKDIDQAIIYFQLAANQKNSEDNYELGCIFMNIKKDSVKAMQYFKLAADKFHPKALCRLGYYLFINGNIEKGLFYIENAANLNEPNAQFILGIVCLNKKSKIFNKNKGINNLILSANTGHHDANFCLGFLYHEGKYIERNINTAISYYKKASTFHNRYAINNLGILYQYSPNISYNIGRAILCFEDAYKQKNDYIAMYNYAHFLFYYQLNKENESIKLLRLSLSIKRDFFPSLMLLCLVIIKYYGSKSFPLHIQLNMNDLPQIIHDILNDENLFKIYLKKYKNIDFLYSNYFTVIQSVNIFSNQNSNENSTAKNLTQQFYEGFYANS